MLLVVLGLSGCSDSEGVRSPPSTTGMPPGPFPLITAPIDNTPYAMTWTLDSAFDPPGLSTTRLHLVVTDPRCNGGHDPEARLLEPEISYEDTEIGIAITARPLPGFQGCPLGPPAFILVELAEPLGSRSLVETGTD